MLSGVGDLSGERSEDVNKVDERARSFSQGVLQFLGAVWAWVFPEEHEDVEEGTRRSRGRSLFS